jgi:hypothetical protein
MKIISLLGEAEMGNKASLPIDRDLLYKARQKYPQYSGEQALTLYIADEMKEKDQVDSNQNRLLDTQKRENERLRSVVNDLGQTVEQELQQVAQQAEINDREISRIKQLTGKLSQGGTDTQRKAKVSGDDLEKLQKDLEMLKTKPGMDPEKYKKLQAQIKELVNNQSFDNTDLAKVRPLIATLNKQKNVGDELYQRLEDQLRKTQSELDKKENRFVKYIQKKTGEVGTMQKTHADEIANYANIVKGYEKQIKDFGNQMSGIEKQLAAVQKEKDITYQLRAGAQQDAQSVADMKDQISAKLELINNITNKLSGQAQNDSNIEEPTGAGPQATVLNTMSTGQGIEKKITKGAEQMLNRKLAEDKTFKPLQKYKNPNYNEWINKHLPALIQVFKNNYWRELERPGSQYSDEQIHYIIEKYTPMLYNLGDEHTPLTQEQVENWMTVVKNKLWEQPVHNQLDLFAEGLDKTYARMLDKIIGLPYI